MSDSQCARKETVLDSFGIFGYEDVLLSPIVFCGAESNDDVNDQLGSLDEVG